MTDRPPDRHERLAGVGWYPAFMLTPVRRTTTEEPSHG